MIRTTLAGRLALGTFIALVTLLCAIPLYWLLVSSFKPIEESTEIAESRGPAEPMKLLAEVPAEREHAAT